MKLLEYLKKSKKLIDKELYKLLPKRLTKKWLEEVYGFSQGFHVKALQEEFVEPLHDFFARGGKRWRPCLLLLATNALKGNEKLALRLTPIVEFIHNSTLIADDIEDNALFRRGKEALHIIYGIDTALNLNNYAYFLPMKLVEKETKLTLEQKNEIYKAYINATLEVSTGQALDINWHKKNYIPTEEQYFVMTSLKTGALAKLATEIASIISNANKKTRNSLAKYAVSLGVAFQIRDDILNLDRKMTLGKEFAEDISEGKKTLIIIRALKQLNEKDKKTLLGILAKKTKNKRLLEKAVKIIEKTDAFEYSQKKAESIAVNAWKNLENVLQESKYKELLKEFLEFVVVRNK